MKSTDERAAEVLQRAMAHETKIRRRRQRAVAVGGGIASVFAITVISINMALVQPSAAPAPSGPFGLMGSVFSDNPALGYIVVGLAGLALGVIVTVLVYRLGRRSHGPRQGRAAAGEQGEVSDGE